MKLKQCQLELQRQYHSMLKMQNLFTFIENAKQKTCWIVLYCLYCHWQYKYKFGGIRQTDCSSVCSKLKLCINENIVVGCPAYILHNTI